MKKTAIALGAALIAVSSLGFAATLNSLDKDQVKQAFVNKTYTSIGITHLNDQSIHDIFVGSMDDMGKIHGKFSHAPPQGPQSDEGVYTIKDDGQICITWQHWQQNKEFCVYVYGTNNAYVLVDVNNTFHTVFLKTDVK